MFSRRSMLRLLGATLFASFSLTSYAFAIEPRFRLAVTRYRLRPARWPALDRPLRVAVLADLHACEPWMPVSRIEEIVETANALKPELIVLLGDYVAGLGHFKTSDVPVKKWASVLAGLKAPPQGTPSTTSRNASNSLRPQNSGTELAGPLSPL